MKEFDLEATKAGKKVMTRDGRKARIVCYDYKGNAPLLVIAENKNSEPLSDRLKQYVQAQTAESVYEYYENGEVCAPHLNPNIASDLTLVMANKKRIYWVNLYNTGSNLEYLFHSKDIFNTEEDALNNINTNINPTFMYNCTVKLELEMEE